MLEISHCAWSLNKGMPEHILWLVEDALAACISFFLGKWVKPASTSNQINVQLKHNHVHMVYKERLITIFTCFLNMYLSVLRTVQKLDRLSEACLSSSLKAGVLIYYMFVVVYSGKLQSSENLTTCKQKFYCAWTSELARMVALPLHIVGEIEPLYKLKKM